MRPRVSTAALSLLLSAVCFQQALSEEPPYLDNRSDAASIVRSLYNAINRHEYARAWDYYGDAKPAADFDTFVKGYEATTSVEVTIGSISSEGAAGSMFFNVPVAIKAVEAGGEKVFAGCYTARLVIPQIQAPPFSALHIERGELAPSTKEYEQAVPEKCGDGPPPPPRDAALEEAKDLFANGPGIRCKTFAVGEPDPVAPESYTIKYHNTGSTEEQEARLFRFFCSMGAYNEDHVYYLSTYVEGVHEIHFAEPELDIHYENGNSEGKVEAINIIGFRSSGQLVNSFYDEATHSLQSYAKWRGVGDASSSGTWLFRDGEFSLVQYDVDASYDGEINPQSVLDYNTAP